MRMWRADNTVLNNVELVHTFCTDKYKHKYVLVTHITATHRVYSMRKRGADNTVHNNVELVHTFCTDM
ncbi:hypothetical protein J6590_070584, partial [Homalodisca vitripennis]